jgi:16S rRNA (guanine527-N7)-methyltransferase
MSRSVRDLLEERARAAHITLTSQIATRLERYFDLLSHWNRTINLTSLPLEPPTEQSIDRLLIEPLRAAPLLAPTVNVWFDLGSGGGSPAIPLQIAHPAPQLFMVESRERKAAFLREVVRALEISGAEVLCTRIESLIEDGDGAGVADLVTVRAVRLSASLFSQLDRLLKVGGQAVLFGTAPQKLELPRGLDIQYAEAPLIIVRRTTSRI